MSHAGYDGIVRLLIEQGAEVRAKRTSWDVLHAALDQGHYRIVQLLVEQGAEVSVKRGW